MFSRCILALVFASAVALSGCSSTPMQRDVGSSMWVPDRGQATVYLYVSYDTPQDEPSFPETFRFRIDQGYMGEFGKGKYVETKVVPGDYVLNVDEVDWGGFVTHHAKLSKQLRANQVVYVAARLEAGKPVFLKEMEIAKGREDTGSRKQTEACDGLTSFFAAIF